jgi:putative membrane protein
LIYAVNAMRLGLSGDAVAGIKEMKVRMTGAADALAQLKPALPGGYQPSMQEIIDAIGKSDDARAKDTTAMAGLNELLFSLTHAADVDQADPGGVVEILGAVQCGLDNTTFGTMPNPKGSGVVNVCPNEKAMVQGIGQLGGGIDLLVGTVISQVQAGVGTPTSGPTTLRGGVAALQGGVSQISAGGTALIEGLSQLGAGADQVAAGNGDLYTGLQQLSTGAGQLAAGAGDARTGAGQLADGNRQIAQGASDLASGLNDAAVGSGKLADGLATAADSAPQLKDGAQRLSDEGTKKLVEAGKSTAADYGEKYALIVAGAERAKSEGMAYGAPEGATGVTAYSLELAGMDGEGDRNVGRGLGALVILGLGTGAAALVRRRFI